MITSRSRWPWGDAPFPLRGAIRSSVLFALAPLVLIAGAACSSGPAVIVFTSDRNGNQDVFSIDPKDGTDTNLTHTAQDEHSAVLSPDRKKIAYLVGTPPQMRLDVIGLDARKVPQKTVAQGQVYTDVHWAPDNKRIAYGARLEDALRLFVADTEGDTPKVQDITPLPVRDLGGWSPNGELLVFSAQAGPDQGIYIRNPGGVNQVRLSNGPDYGARWSPDGNHIAFLSTRDGNPEVYVMKANGSDVRRLTRTSGEEFQVVWSPKSDRLAFVSRTDGNPEVYTVDLKGEALTRLTYNEVDDLSPAWSADGSRIVFTSYLHGNGDIYLMDADGKDQQRLTSSSDNETQPDW